MSDTPETKKTLDYIYDRDGELWERNAPEKLVTLCRKLERERDEARKERERAETKCAAEYEAHKMTQAERDALRAEADQLKADKARLDWLEKRESMEGFTRAAIDAAMKGEL